VAAAQVVAVVGSVRSPGLVAWREGLTVADAIQLAGGAIPPVRQEFVGLASKVRRVRQVIEDYEALLTTVLLPNDQLFVAGPMRVETKTHR
jgi:protein involved in polysaccharide export with SLBB domain